MNVTANPIELHMAFERLEFETGFDVRAVIAERDALRKAADHVLDASLNGIHLDHALNQLEAALG